MRMTRIKGVELWIGIVAHQIQTESNITGRL